VSKYKTFRHASGDLDMGILTIVVALVATLFFYDRRNFSFSQLLNFVLAIMFAVTFPYIGIPVLGYLIWKKWQRSQIDNETRD